MKMPSTAARRRSRRSRRCGPPAGGAGMRPRRRCSMLSPRWSLPAPPRSRRSRRRGGSATARGPAGCSRRTGSPAWDPLCGPCRTWNDRAPVAWPGSTWSSATTGSVAPIGACRSVAAPAQRGRTRGRPGPRGARPPRRRDESPAPRRERTVEGARPSWAKRRVSFSASGGRESPGREPEGVEREPESPSGGTSCRRRASRPVGPRFVRAPQHASRREHRVRT